MMLNITNRKISTFDVRWASFPGFTILFNNIQSSEEKSLLNNDLINNSKLIFYKIIAQCIEQLNENSLLIKKYFLCVLPWSTYHVTLWSGLNIRTIDQINSKYHSMVERWLSDTYSNEIPKEIIQFPLNSSLCLNRQWNIHFQFDRLNIWNNSVLVVCLRPHPDSEMIFSKLCEDRLKLNAEYVQHFNVLTDSDLYQPHISLGYFANEEGALKAFQSLDQWNILFSNALEEKMISFENVNIYVFTDMIHFFKS